MQTEETVLDVQNLSVKYIVRPHRTIRSVLGSGYCKSKVVIANNDISFSVKKGEILGIIGPNGSGKSTLLRAIAGLFSIDEGFIDTHNNSVSLLSLGTGFISDISGRENLILAGLLMGFSRKEVFEKMDQIIEFSEIKEAIDFPVRTYSSGMFSRLAFSLSITMKTNILLIDEVLSVGDQRFKKKSYDALKSIINEKDRTVLIVSHNLSEIVKLCDRVVWMDKGSIVKIGEPKEIVDEYSK